MRVGPPVIGLSGLGIFLANALAWALGHGMSGYWAHRLPAHRLTVDGPVLRHRHIEARGRIYERLRIRAWKDRLPEAGALFTGGTSKRTLPHAADRLDTLATFRREASRAERSHWASLAVLPVFWLWNPPWGVALMVLYGLGVNAPFIAVQRYNRARIDRILARHQGTGSSGRDRMVS